jgi:hypothetical protein
LTVSLWPGVSAVFIDANDLVGVNYDERAA